MKRKINRRQFFGKTVAASLFAGALPTLVPGSVLGLDGAVPPSERITMGLIGCGSHGAGWNTNLMLANNEQQLIAVCDVDQLRLDKAKKKVESYYEKKTGRAARVDAYTDFRDLVNRKDIDAVDIVTPDHWHVLMSVFAMKAGKHVLCEKPTLTIEEGQILVDVQKKTKRVFLTGSQNRTVDTNQQIINIVRNGLIGKLKNIKVPMPPGNRKRGNMNFEVCPIPETLDYEKWSGPAPILPFIPARLHINWRNNLAYSGGTLPDWAAHYVNMAQWANDADNTSPVAYWGNTDNPKTRWHFDKDAPWNTTGAYDISCVYANGVRMRIWNDSAGIKFEGDKGWVLAKGPSLYASELTASDERILQWQPGPGDIDVGKELQYCTVSRKKGKGLIGVQGGEHVHLTHCIKTGQTPYYTAEMGHKTDIAALAGNTLMYLGGLPLEWDPVKEVYIGENAEAANASFFTKREQREPWTFANVDSWIN